MAAKRTLNANNLEALGASELAALLIEVSSGNAVIQRRLRLALATAEGVDDAAQEVRKRLAAIDRSTSFVDSRKRKALLADLEAQQQAIIGPIADADPGQAHLLLLRFLELAEGVMERCSDSTGSVVGLFERAAADLGPLALAAQVQPQALAEQVADLLAENGYGQFDQLIPAMKEALGEEGLQQLERAFLERGGPDASTSLRQIAECRGDMDAYLAQFNDTQLSWPDTAAEVALQLLAADRAGQALATLERAARGAASWHAPEWDDAHIAVLEALGRSEEAQKERWRCFAKLLSIPHLRDYLRRLDDFEDVEAEAKAFQLAEAHALPLLTLQFLVGWGALPRAARFVIENREQWNGEAHAVYGPAAERLSADHPVAATLLLRAMVVFTLSSGKARRYRYAAEQLRTCALLDSRIEDWQGVMPHSEFAGRLREAFAGKWSFWTLLER